MVTKKMCLVFIPNQLNDLEVNFGILEYIYIYFREIRVQWKLLNANTFGQRETDFINRMITIISLFGT
jgi:hypothetical protein